MLLPIGEIQTHKFNLHDCIRSIMLQDTFYCNCQPVNHQCGIICRLVTCASDCEQLQSENCILERRLDDQQQRISEYERREQEATQRVRDTLQLVDEAQIDREEVSTSK